MKTICLYPLEIKETQELEMPENSEILELFLDNKYDRIPKLWVLIDKDEIKKIKRVIRGIPYEFKITNEIGDYLGFWKNVETGDTVFFFDEGERF